MRIHVYVSRHSAFYIPLIGALAAGFLRDEGLDADYAMLAAGQTSRELIRSGAAHVVQSAVSSSWPSMEKGEVDLPLHFAQINSRDGFFLVSRRHGSAFRWRLLEDAELLGDHAAQPMAMLRYAIRRQGVELAKVRMADAGSPAEMDRAFREGRGDFVHLQSPAAQQLEEDGLGVIAASVGEAMPPVAFSSLVASREFVNSVAGQAFVSAYRKSKQWAHTAPPDEIAASQASYFPGVSRESLAETVRRYQRLGCWDGGLEIPRVLYQQSIEVFLTDGRITQRHAYEEVVIPPARGG